MTDDKPIFVEFARAVLNTLEESAIEFKIDDVGIDEQLKKVIDPETQRVIYCFNFMALTTNEKARDALAIAFDALTDKNAKQYIDLSKMIRIHSKKR